MIHQRADVTGQDAEVIGFRVIEFRGIPWPDHVDAIRGAVLLEF